MRPIDEIEREIEYQRHKLDAAKQIERCAIEEAEIILTKINRLYIELMELDRAKKEAEHARTE